MLSEFREEYDLFIDTIREDLSSYVFNWKQNIESYDSVEGYLQSIYNDIFSGNAIKDVYGVSGAEFLSFIYADENAFEELRITITDELTNYYRQYISEEYGSTYVTVYDNWLLDIVDLYKYNNKGMHQFLMQTDILNQLEFIDEKRIEEIALELNNKFLYIDDELFYDWINNTDLEFKGKPVEIKDILFDLGNKMIHRPYAMISGVIRTAIMRMIEDENNIIYSTEGIEYIIEKYGNDLITKFKKIV